MAMPTDFPCQLARKTAKNSTGNARSPVDTDRGIGPMRRISPIQITLATAKPLSIGPIRHIRPITSRTPHAAPTRERRSASPSATQPFPSQPAASRESLSPTADEVQTVGYSAMPLGPSGGSFTLTFDGQTTALIAYNASAAAVQAALEGRAFNIFDVVLGGSLRWIHGIRFCRASCRAAASSVHDGSCGGDSSRRDLRRDTETWLSRGLSMGSRRAIHLPGLRSQDHQNLFGSLVLSTSGIPHRQPRHREPTLMQPS